MAHIERLVAGARYDHLVAVDSLDAGGPFVVRRTPHAVVSRELDEASRLAREEAAADDDPH